MLFLTFFQTVLAVHHYQRLIVFDVLESSCRLLIMDDGRSLNMAGSLKPWTCTASSGIVLNGMWSHEHGPNVEPMHKSTF